MQNFESNPQDTLSAQEARAVMEAITHRQQAVGANLDGKSVETLASGLGVTQDEVRKILEDIRVQRRSEQLAAGILQREQTHRKRLDVTAAIGAAIAIFIVAIVIGGFLFLRGAPTAAAGPGTPVPAPEAVPTPFPPPGGPGVIHVEGDDGSIVDINEHGINIKHPDGTTTNVQDEVRRGLNKEIESLERQKAELDKLDAATDAQKAKRQAIEQKIEALDEKLDEIAESAAASGR